MSRAGAQAIGGLEGPRPRLDYPSGTRDWLPDQYAREGDVIDSEYEVERVLGEGGMGIVVAARDLVFGDEVAIKLLRPELRRRPEAVIRFLREAHETMRISSEHVVHVSGIGRVADGTPYMVMELLEGADLARILRERGVPFGVEQAVDYLLQACEAVAEAHALGIVHRDLKPANLFLEQRPDGSTSIKVLDFGISKSGDPEDEADFSIGARPSREIVGSPAYMSPEQVLDWTSVDGRADVWSLGATLYELLTGELVFGGGSLEAILARISADSPVPLGRGRSEVPTGLERVIIACLEKAPARRLPSVADLARALLPFAPESSRPTVARIEAIAPKGTTTPLELAGWRRRRRRRLLRDGARACALVLVGAAAAMLLAGGFHLL